jgi:spore maturation protein CgeB
MLTPERAREIGERARHRILAEHTYAQRAAMTDALLRQALARKRQSVAA